MQGTVVGVLRGGPSHDHDGSLRSGHAVLSVLPRERYTVRDIYIDRDGVWHERGLQTTPNSVLPTLDVAIVALHGTYGEDGGIQKLLEQYGVPYTGSTSFPSFEAAHKVIAKQKAQEVGLRVPRSVYLESDDGLEEALHQIVRTYPQPVVVKPPKWGSSVGVTAPTGYQPIHQAVTGLFAEDAGGALVEEFVRGTEATVTVVEHMRGEDLYAVPPVEIVLPASERLLSYELKHSGGAYAVAPGRFSKDIAAQLENAARRMHTALGLRHYSRSDFIVSPKGIYYLETNSLPHLSVHGLTPRALASVGIGFGEFIEHIIALALGRKKR